MYIDFIWGNMLMGSLSFILGLCLFFYPPKDINPFYGYRIPLATKNKDIWLDANKYCGKILILGGIISFVFGKVLNVLIDVNKLRLPDEQFLILESLKFNDNSYVSSLFSNNSYRKSPSQNI